MGTELLREDLRCYRKELERLHPGLNLYTGRAATDSLFNDLVLRTDRPMTALEFQQLLALSCQWVKDGHTVSMPSEATRTYHDRNSRFVPYQLALINGHLYIKRVYTPDLSVPEGARVMALNGVPAGDVVEQMARRLPRDGNNMAYPYWIIDSYFREFYSYTFGHADSLEVVWQKDGLPPVSSIVMALPKDSIGHFRATRYPDILTSEAAERGIEYEVVNTSERIARLTIRDFHNDGLRTVYGQHFKREIRSVFHRIRQDSIAHLILDLRDNQGGDVGNGIFLLSRLLNMPFRVITEYRKRQDATVRRCGGAYLGYHRPVSHPYQGKLHVMINGGSFSNSIIVASCLRENKRARFWGTESGGNACVINGDAKSLTLPHTKTVVDIPTRQYVLTYPWSDRGSGLIPESHLKQDATKVSEHSDPIFHDVLHQVIQQIETERKEKSARMF